MEPVCCPVGLSCCRVVAGTKCPCFTTWGVLSFLKADIINISMSTLWWYVNSLALFRVKVRFDLLEVALFLQLNQNVMLVRLKCTQVGLVVSQRTDRCYIASCTYTKSTHGPISTLQVIVINSCSKSKTLKEYFFSCHLVIVRWVHFKQNPEQKLPQT